MLQPRALILRQFLARRAGKRRGCISLDFGVIGLPIG